MRRATYHYRLRDFKGGYTAHKVRVEIVNESEKSYQVRYLEPGTRGQYAGTVKWVRKRNIRWAEEVRTIPIEIRLPYKD